MIQLSPRQGISFLAEDSLKDRSNSEERERVLWRLPASIQAMLLRAERTLSENEIERISRATADHRCEALRMVFEGKTADEAVAFLLAVCDETSAPTMSLRSSTLPVAAESAGDCRAVGGCREDYAGNLLRLPHSASVVCEKVVDVQCRVLPSVRSAAMSRRSNTSDGGVMETDDDVADPDVPHFFCASPPQPFPHPFSTRGLTEMKVNTTDKAASKSESEKVSSCCPVLAKRRLPIHTVKSSRIGSETCLGGGVDTNIRARCNSPVVSTPLQSTATPSAWNEHFKTFIVHPNQLKRLQDGGRQISPPATIRRGGGSPFRRQMTVKCGSPSGQGTGVARSHLSPSKLRCQVSADSDRGGKSFILRGGGTSCPPGRTEQPSTPVCVPPLKDLEKLRSKANVFQRIGSNNTPEGTLRRGVPLVQTCRTPRDSFTPRVAPFQRISSCNTNRTPRTPRCAGKGESPHSRLFPPSPWSPSQRSFRPCTPTRPFSARQGNVASPTISGPRKMTPPRRRSSGPRLLQRLERAATTMCVSSRFGRTFLGTSRRGSDSAHHAELSTLGRHTRGRPVSTRAAGLKRSATVAAWR